MQKFKARKDWCARQDLNLHALRHYHLKVARLPIPPRAHGTHIMNQTLGTRRKANLVRDTKARATDERNRSWGATVVYTMIRERCEWIALGSAP